MCAPAVPQQILPALVLAMGMPLLPESPRWLMLRGDEADARRALMHIRKSNGLDVLQELHEMRTREPRRISLRPCPSMTFHDPLEPGAS